MEILTADLPAYDTGAREDEVRERWEAYYTGLPEAELGK
jgi:hypothetical protein